MARGFRFITFLSDYGLEDEFVGVCRGVIKTITPDVEVIDVTHGIPPQDVRAGATILGQSIRYFPPAVHLAIVDPGVGTTRRAIVARCVSGPVMVGPDNGLLWPGIEALGGLQAAYSIENKALILDPPSKTFQGRDVFAPVAAHLAGGADPASVGPRLHEDELVRLRPLAPRVDDDHIHARVVQFDRFGNLQLNVARQDLEGIGVLLGDTIEVRAGGVAFSVVWGQAFGEVPAGRMLLLEDSYRWMTVAINQGSARERLEAKRGDPVILARVRVGSPTG